MRGNARSSVKEGGTGRGVQVTLGSGFGWRLMGRFGFGIVVVGAVSGALGGLGTLGFGGGSGICLPFAREYTSHLGIPVQHHCNRICSCFLRSQSQVANNRNE
jgi:hypothetical protein